MMIIVDSGLPFSLEEVGRASLKIHFVLTATWHILYSLLLIYPALIYGFVSFNLFGIYIFKNILLLGCSGGAKKFRASSAWRQGLSSHRQLIIKHDTYPAKEREDAFHMVSTNQIY
jgi:hypothetical protein